MTTDPPDPLEAVAAQLRAVNATLRRIEAVLVELRTGRRDHAWSPPVDEPERSRIW